MTVCKVFRPNASTVIPYNIWLMDVMLQRLCVEREREI